MKKIKKSITVVVCLISFVSFAQRIDFSSEKDNFFKEDGIIYYKSDIFTGQIFENHENGQLKYEMEFEDGIYVEDITYYDDGQLRGKRTQFKEEDYYKNGQLRRKVHYNQDGEKDGLTEKYFEDGRLKYKYTYKDNIKDGPYENNVDNAHDSGYGYYSEGELIED
tara:strand:+ start:130 stop:624 length:495 start_codon:yes stop_codon:yes gene_type:complete